MRLVLLPGLNGSSRLFSPLLAQLADIDCQVLELPKHGQQDHAYLATCLIEHLGKTPFVMLGESFSGPLAYQLALRCPTGLRGLILVASFLQRPHPLVQIASRIPLPPPRYIPAWLLRHFCINGAPQGTLQLIEEEVRSLPRELLHHRLSALAQLPAVTASLSLPTLHLRPGRDRLVSPKATASIARAFNHLEQEVIEGPHFLLQSRPQACAAAIRRFMAMQQD